VAIDDAGDEMSEGIAADLAFFAYDAVDKLADLPSPQYLALRYRVPTVTVFAGMSRCAAVMAVDGPAFPGSGPAMTVLAAAGMCRRLSELSRDDAGMAAATRQAGEFLAASRRVLRDGPPALETGVAAKARELLAQQPPAVLKAAFPWQHDTRTKLNPVAASFPSSPRTAPPGRRAGQHHGSRRNAGATRGPVAAR
jgi:hypothetical protein